MNKLRKKNVDVRWGKEEDRAFQAFKESLINTTQLAPLNIDFPIILAIDESSYGIGAVLSSRYPDGSERPIAFASKPLNDTEQHHVVQLNERRYPSFLG